MSFYRFANDLEPSGATTSRSASALQTYGLMAGRRRGNLRYAPPKNPQTVPRKTKTACVTRVACLLRRFTLADLADRLLGFLNQSLQQ
jgi:hypothetical protein